MKSVLPFLFLSLFFPAIAKAQLFADFETTEGNFTVLLEYDKAPLACSNFVLLAGKPDDIWETPPGAASITSGLYQSTVASDVNRLNLNVAYVPPAEPDAPPQNGRYDIYQSNTYIGSTDAFETSGAYRDITGAGRFEIRRINFTPNRFQIKFHYKRPWLDSRFSLIRETPMYVNIPITRVEPGKRFFSGSFTNNPFEHPGYHFQDESILAPGNGNNPYGIPFNAPYILAMDSSGTNTNGSRFFITAAGDTTWNGKYTAIGVVQQNIGRQVVINIANTKVTGNNVPQKQMSITKITFRHLGEAVRFFETFHQNKLPGQIREIPLGISREGGELSLVTPPLPQSQIVIHQSTDLKNFSGGGLLTRSPRVETPQLEDLSASVVNRPKLFFRGYSTELPTWPSDAMDFDGGRYSFRLNSGNALGTLSITFETVEGRVAAAIYQVDSVVQWNQLGGGSITRTAKGSGTMAVSYNSELGPFKGKLTFTSITGPLDIDEMILNFESTPVGVPVVVRSFSAIKSDTGPLFFGYTGHYQKAN